MGLQGAALQAANVMTHNKMFEIMPRLALVAAIVCAVAIAFLSLLPGEDLPSQNLNDKLNHFIAYGVLTCLAVVGRGSRSFLWVAALAIGYGALLEVLQGIMPYGRSASSLDALANAGGVVIGVVLAFCVQGLLRQGRQR